ncbi:MAG: HlyD family efflux transporter periplasmic adaptor subunit [Gemmatimonadota bacterium]
MDIVRTPPKRRTRSVLIAGGVAALLAVIVVVARLGPALPTLERAAVLVDSVRQGDVVREVRAVGTLVPEQLRWITAQASARVERVHVQAGQQVVAGELLLELSNPDLQLETMQAEQQVRQAESALLALRTNLRSGLLTQEGVVATMKTQHVSALQEAAGADSLLRLKLVATFDARNRRAAAEEMTTRLRVEQERLTLLREAIDAQVSTQVSQVTQLRAIAANQRARLSALQVRAPEAGVLQDLTLQLGQWVPEGTTLAKVVQPGRLKAVLRIPESQAKDVQLNQVTAVDTRNGIVRGHVMRKDPSAQQGSVTIDVALDGALPPGAVPDLSVDGTIQIERLTNVRYTGRPSVAVPNAQTTLFRLTPDGNEAERVSVQVGRTSASTIEILGGLSVGDRVILSDMSAYLSAAKVRLK